MQYQRGAKCITSNKAVKDWPEMLAGDEVITAAILDRLLHASHVLNIRGLSYGCKITATDTIYYCDDLEMGRHPTLEVSKKTPFYFLINLATGGGWPVDLACYGGIADIYVDYLRVYSANAGDVERAKLAK